MLKTVCARAVLAAACCSGLGCTADVLGGGGPAGSGGPGTVGVGGGGGPGGAGGPGVDPAAGGPPPPTVLRRLTRIEYNSTLRDLLGDETRPAQSFLVDETKLGFDNIAEVQTTSPVRAEQYMMAAEKLAASAKTALLAALPCTAAGDAACAGTLIRDFGVRAYRRPLSETEVNRLLGVFSLGSQNGGFEHGVELALRAMLISPSFLFRVEVGEAVADMPNVKRPTSWEMASRLSYTLLGTLPDAALFQAASENALLTKAQIGAQAERLLSDPRAKTNVQHLHGQWFEVDDIDPVKIKKDAALFPDFNDEFLRFAKQETATFLDEIVWNAADGAKAIFTAGYSFMNAKWASFYGVSGATGDAFTRVSLDPTRRAGLLTQASILAKYAHGDQTSPTLRGKFVRERLLCNVVPPPPPTVDTNLEPPTAATNARERSEQHLNNPTCAGCHNLLDPIGLGFEHYNAIGAWQDQEGGKPIDATGSVSGAAFSPPHDGNFDGVPSLAAQLAESPDVQACITKHWFRFAYGREETEHDAAVLTGLTSSLQASGGNLKQLLLDLTQTDAFLYRGAELE